MTSTPLDFNAYLETAALMVPRVLTLGDRDSDSPTFGCYDRYHWHYQSLDFANARFQEAAWLLACLYTYPYNGSLYYHNPHVKQWALSAIAFWGQIQKKDGSFDEVYPFEHSFVSTAFSTFAVTEAILILDTTDFNASVEKAATWLMHHNNYRVANQMAGTAAALYNAYLITQKTTYKNAAQHKLEKLAQLQDESGYFIEYGGYDMGYLSIGLSYLTRYFEKSQNELAYTMIQKAIAFAKTKVNNTGTYDYSQTSRHTQYLYPYGFLHDPEKVIINSHLNGLRQNRVVSPLVMDDRFFIPLTVDYFTTFLKANAHAHDTP